MEKGKAIFGATDKRIECHSACVSHHECRECPFYGLCENEDYFPSYYDGINCEDFIPSNYVKSGNLFM